MSSLTLKLKLNISEGLKTFVLCDALTALASKGCPKNDEIQSLAYTTVQKFGVT